MYTCTSFTDYSSPFPWRARASSSLTLLEVEDAIHTGAEAILNATQSSSMAQAAADPRHSTPDESASPPNTSQRDVETWRTRPEADPWEARRAADAALLAPLDRIPTTSEQAITERAVRPACAALHASAIIVERERTTAEPPSSQIICMQHHKAHIRRESSKKDQFHVPLLRLLDFVGSPEERHPDQPGALAVGTEGGRQQEAQETAA